ncbi:glycolipid transfer protein domain-containing protein [Mycena maculata]|uniref:Glycolipid transfer protein domain-containing protein n=1 Tax=Mycena maculata TaxID=230809 RepID=A0AAD7KBP5_9AGAR|nr:glycolipid transfer protein domain-containing protein [Mycena maculata]
MAPYFETIKISFADVDTDPGVNTLQFLDACDDLVRLFDILGPAFSMVQSDLNGNITKVRAVAKECGTLQGLVEKKQEEKTAAEKTATEGLMWLFRALSFTCEALQIVQKEKEKTDKDRKELSAAFTESYKLKLKPFHNFVVQGFFSAAMIACPSRGPFYAQLAVADPATWKDVTAGQLETLNVELDKWLEALASIIGRMKAVYGEDPKNKKKPLIY